MFYNVNCPFFHNILSKHILFSYSLMSFTCYLYLDNFINTFHNFCSPTFGVPLNYLLTQLVSTFILNYLKFWYLILGISKCSYVLICSLNWKVSRNYYFPNKAVSTKQAKSQFYIYFLNLRSSAILWDSYIFFMSFHKFRIIWFPFYKHYSGSWNSIFFFYLKLKLSILLIVYFGLNWGSWPFGRYLFWTFHFK